MTERGRFKNLVVLPQVAGLGDPERGRHPSITRFEIEGVDVCCVNALRRVIQAEVETVAIPFDPMDPTTNVPNAGLLSPSDNAHNVPGIRFFVNSGQQSGQHNEELGHRLSLIVIDVPENELRGYSPLKYLFRIRVKADGLDGKLDNATRLREVTTEDIEVLDETGAQVPRAVRNALFPPSPVTGDHVPLARLRAGKLGENDGDEEIHVQFRARLGTGKEHARWSAVSSCFHIYRPDPKRVEASFNAKLEAAKKAANVETLDSAVVERIRRDHLSLDAKRDFEQDENGEPTAFVFEIHSECSLRGRFLVQQGFRVLSKKVRDLANGLVASATADDAESNVRVEKVVNDDDLYRILVNGEDHTLGSCVTGMFDKVAERDKVLLFAFNEPHPLESRIVFDIRLAEPGLDVRDVLVKGLTSIVKDIDDLAAEWNEFAGMKDPFPLPAFRPNVASSGGGGGNAWV